MKQSINASLSQKVNPQLILQSRVTAAPLSELDLIINQKIIENPLLEEVSDQFEPLPNELDSDNSHLLEDFSGPKMQGDGYNPNLFERIIAEPFALKDYLGDQMRFNGMTENEQAIGHAIIHSVSDRGLLISEDPKKSFDPTDFVAMLAKQNINTDTAELLQVLGKVQRLDPVGIGSRSTREFLLLKVSTLPQEETAKMATQILTHSWDDFEKEEFKKMAETLKINNREKLDDFQKGVDLLRNMDTFPIASDNSLNQVTKAQLIPDFTIVKNGDRLDIQVGENRNRRVVINDPYKHITGPPKNPRDKEGYDFIQESRREAIAFIEALSFRRKAMSQFITIVASEQKEFLLSGNMEDIKALSIKDIAAKMAKNSNKSAEELYSTASEMARRKIVATDFGIFPVHKLLEKSFEKGLTRHQVSDFILDTVKRENKVQPLSDKKLAEQLTKEFGYEVKATRVKHLRSSLNIPDQSARVDVKYIIGNTMGNRIDNIEAAKKNSQGDKNPITITVPVVDQQSSNQR